MAESSSSNCKIYIGGQGDLGTEASWVLVGSIMDLGEFGDTAEIITYATLEDARQKKLKGVADAGDMQVMVAFDSANAGQTALQAAAADFGSVPYNIKVELNDQITPSTGSNSEYTFKAFVMSFRLQVGGANNVVQATVPLAITSAISKSAAD